MGWDPYKHYIFAYMFNHFTIFLNSVHMVVSKDGVYASHSTFGFEVYGYVLLACGHGKVKDRLG